MTLSLGFLVGCLDPAQVEREQKNRGMIVMLPGVEGTTISMVGLVSGLRDAGEDRAIDIVRWGVAPFGTFKNLCDLPRNRRQAKKIADKIVAYQKANPQRPVTLIGYSGGGGIAVLTAQALPAGTLLDRIILIAPALSQDYDLTSALAHARRGIVHFYSQSDWAQLGIGTSQFGTIDRKYMESAGRRGFQGANGELLNNDKIQQIAWRPEWIQLGHFGGHLGWLSRLWASEVLAKYVDTSADHVDCQLGGVLSGAVGAE